MNKVIGVAGFKNAGKTTLVEKLVRNLTGLGLRVSTVKHAHHSFDIDHEGRDSFRHRKAGASEVAVVSRDRTAIIHELRGAEPPSLDEVLKALKPCDLVIVEGYKRDTHDKIEVRNVELAHPALAGDDKTVVAIAANGDVTGAGVPVFSRDDVAALAAFIIDHCGLSRPSPVQGFVLRRATARDANAVRELTRAVYAKWIPAVGREPFPMKADYDKAVAQHWVDLLEEPGTGTLVAVAEMIPQGTFLMLENLAIAEDHQGKGFGQAMLRHTENIARANGFTEERLYTNAAFSGNPEFYARQGYDLFRQETLPDGSITVHFRKTLA